jgi:hypothetical protein
MPALWFFAIKNTYQSNIMIAGVALYTAISKPMPFVCSYILYPFGTTF